MIPAAILDTTLPPLERAQLLAQTAEGLAAVEQPAAALDAARQAQIIAAKTPDLLPAQRSQVFTVLRTLAPSWAMLRSPSRSRIWRAIHF